MMKKIWALLLALMMMLSSISALAEGVDGDTGTGDDPAITETGSDTDSESDAGEETDEDPVDVGAPTQPVLKLLRGLDVVGEYTYNKETAEWTVVNEEPEATATGTFTYDSENKTIQVTSGALKIAGTTPEEWKIIINNTQLTMTDSEVTYDTDSSTILIAKGAATVSTEGSSSDRLLLDGDDVKLTLAGVDITPAIKEAAIQVTASSSATITLMSGTKNYCYGNGSYAGIEASWDGVSNYSSLTIDGDGYLYVKGGNNSAGIGGSKDRKGVHGDITISGGTIDAYGGDVGSWNGAAGIGTSDNPNNGASNGSFKYTEKWGSIKITDGKINAYGSGIGAGIGGGNHSDSGKIEISGGNIYAKGHTGIGSGYGSSKYTDKDTAASAKGPGYYYADITISGSPTIEAVADLDGYGKDTDDGGAGIGGGEYCDATISISGNPTIHAYGAVAGGGYHHGGAGIGGGYLGHASITINGGHIYAYAGDAAAGIGSGAGANNNGDRGSSRRNGAFVHDATSVTIRSGTIHAYGYQKDGTNRGGAGIGGGVGASGVSVTISGGTIFAEGALSNSSDMRGGAGIGSAFDARNVGSEAKYSVYTPVSISISGGTITAIGGWGASGIGSGSNNKTAESIAITNNVVDLQAFADGTKFAIDTRKVDDAGFTTSITEGRSIGKPVIQGTFVHNYTVDGIGQNAEGLGSIVIENDATGTAVRTLNGMPSGYRSFAATLGSSGTYNIYTGSNAVSNGEGRYFAEAAFDSYYKEGNEYKDNIKYTVTGNSLSDNFYLYPVKTIVVEKKITNELGVETLSDLNETFYFNLLDSEGTPVYDDLDDLVTIDVDAGVVKNRGYFVNVPDGVYNVIEVMRDGSEAEGNLFGAYELKKVTMTSKQRTDKVEVTNHFGPSTIDLTVTKNWVDTGYEASRPASITVRLYANGTEVDFAALNAVGEWKHTFTGLKKIDDNGSEINYTVTEDFVPGYGTTVSGLEVTNTRRPAISLIAPSSEKVYDGTALTEDGSNPEKPVIVVGLPAGFTLAEAVVEGSIINTGITANTITSYVIRDAEGKDVTAEFADVTLIDGYLRITPRPLTITTGTASKLYDGTALTSSENTVTGLAPGDVITVTPNGTITEVGNVQNTYTIDWGRVLPANYAVTDNLGTLTILPTLSVTVTKVWNDGNNQDNIRAESIVVNLLADGEITQSRTLSGNGNRWTTVFTALPELNAAGEYIDYTVTENAVPGYTTAITGNMADGYTITNSHTPDLISISGTKTWNDGNNVDGIRPASITVHLMADGRIVASQTVNNDSYTFRNLQRYANGREIVYTISEDEVPGYTTEVNGYNLTNTHTPLRVNISGTKTWADHENADGLRPASIQVSLMADGRVVETRTVTGTGDTWSYSFENLPGYAAGKLIKYTVSEDAVEGYETTIVGNDIYNVHQSAGAQPEKYTLTIRYWADGQTAFPDFTATYNYGDKYEIISPVKPGYTVDLATVAGVILGDTVIDVYYTPSPVKLMIYYQFMDGSIAADTYNTTLMPGDPYSVNSPVIEGYTATMVQVSGTAPYRDTEYVVWYLPVLDEIDPETGRTRVAGGYSLIDDYGVPLGLGEVNRNAGECIE